MKYLFILLLFSSSFAFGQIQTRTMLQGDININKKNADLRGIQVYNQTSLQSTKTDKEGKFILPVAVGDRLEIISVQFPSIIIEVTESIVKRGELTLMINENRMITELEEIVLKPVNLSGELMIDVAEIETKNPNLPHLNTEALAHDPEKAFSTEKDRSIENVAMEDIYLKHGLNFANIFRRIFQEKGQRELSSRELKTQIQKAVADDFFQEYLGLSRKQIPAFINYVEKHGLTTDMLKKKNQLEFIDFLVGKSREFKKQVEQ